MSDDCSKEFAIAEFARNQMVRADHTISWAGPVVQYPIDKGKAAFEVRQADECFLVIVSQIK